MAAIETKDKKLVAGTRIEAAAVLYRMRVYTGQSYTEALEKCAAEFPEAFSEFSSMTGYYGFVDQLGTFVTQEEAAEIALLAGQITEPKARLEPEDLWT